MSSTSRNRLPHIRTNQQLSGAYGPLTQAQKGEIGEIMSKNATPEVQEETQRYAAYSRAIKKEKRAYDMLPERRKKSV